MIYPKKHEKLTLPIGVNPSHVACKIVRSTIYEEMGLRTFSSGSFCKISAVNFVNIYPGLGTYLSLRVDAVENKAYLRQFTRTFCFAHSTAKLEAICLTAAFDAL